MTKTETFQHKARVKDAFSNNRWYLSGYGANIRIRSETVSALFESALPKSVADLGCGDGSLSIALLERGSAVTFLDLSDAMLHSVSARIRDEDRGRATFINRDFLDAQLPAAAFDLLIFVGVLAYIENLDEAAARLRELIKPQGNLLLEYTDASHPMARLNFTYRDLTARLRAPKCTTYRHTNLQIDAAMSKVGFITVKSYRYIYTLPLLLRFLAQDKRYRLIKGIFGTINAPRMQWFGSEVITRYKLEAA